MSQHFFDGTCKGVPVTVMMGWDRPLSQFFLVVQHRQDAIAGENAECEDGDEGIIYSNLNELLPRSLGLGHFRSKLTTLGIAVPEAMFEQVLLDEAGNVGNRCVVYEADGTVTESTI